MKAGVTATATGFGTGLSSSLGTEFELLPAFGVPRDRWDAIAPVLGPMAAWRAYNTPKANIPAQFPGSGYKVPAGVTTPVVSIRPSRTMGTSTVPDVQGIVTGARDAELAAWIEQAPPGAMVSCWHETEAHIPDPVDVTRMHLHVHELCRRIRPDVAYGQISMTWTADKRSAHYPLTKWIAPGMDFQGLDVYPADLGDGFTDAARDALAQITRVDPAARIAFTEVNFPATGAAFKPPAQQVADVFTVGWKMARDVGALTFMPYYGNIAWPPDPVVVDALRAIAHDTLATHF